MLTFGYKLTQPQNVTCNEMLREMLRIIKMYNCNHVKNDAL